MLFDLKNRPFVSATFHHPRRRFAPEAKVAAIGNPKMAYLDVEIYFKNKFSMDLILFYVIWQLKLSQEVGNLSVQ